MSFSHSSPALGVGRSVGFSSSEPGRTARYSRPRARVRGIFYFLLSAACFCTASLGAPPAPLDPSVFGSLVPRGPSLIGIFYDLKQTQNHEKTKMGPEFYDALINEFLASNWDEGVLNRFFRATQPMYSTQVFVPNIAAASAPAAFQVQRIVHPSFWLIHYKGQVSPPTNGLWRFWGFGSEVCSVAVNGRTVLQSNWIENGHPIASPGSSWQSSAGPGQRVRQAHMVASDWLDLKAGQVVDLDILIGERAGGNFCATLCIEKKGDKYQQIDGHPILPVFQLAPFKTPNPESRQQGPQISQDGPIWKAIQ